MVFEEHLRCHSCNEYSYAYKWSICFGLAQLVTDQAKRSKGLTTPWKRDIYAFDHECRSFDTSALSGF